MNTEHTTEHHTQAQYEGHLLADVDTPVSLPQSLLLGVQHVLAMDVYIVPFLIAALDSIHVSGRRAGNADSNRLVHAPAGGARPVLHSTGRDHCHRVQRGRVWEVWPPSTVR